MSCASSLSERIVTALVRTPPHLPYCTPTPRSTITWIRTITSSRSRAQGVSFGAESDAILEQHRKARKPVKKSKASVAATTAQIASETDDYEIDNFIDRSQQSSPARKSAAQSKIQPVDPSSTQKPPNHASPSNIRKLNQSAPGIKQLSAKQESWNIQRKALKEKFPEGWNPRKKLSPDAMEGIRGLHTQDPVKYSTPVLAEQFKVSPEAIRRILKSKWASKAGEEKIEERRDRWAKRHDRIWDQQAELGLRPRRTKETGVEDPDKFEKEMVRKEILGEI